MARALDTLKQEHRDMEKLLHALERQLAAFDDGKPVDYEIVEAIVDYSFAYPDLCHHPVEDAIYERLRQRDRGALDRRVDLQAEHRKLAELTRKFSALLKGVMQEIHTPRDWFSKTARDYVDFTRNHMEMEERYFFPVAEAVLTADDWSGIEARIDSEQDPLFSARVHRRLQRLRDDILAWEEDAEPTAQRSNA